MDITTLSICIGLFITIFTFFYKLIIIPLSEAIKQLEEMIKEVRLDIRKENEVRNRFEVRLTLCEEKVNRLEGARK